MKMTLFLLFFVSLNSQAFFGHKDRKFLPEQVNASSICRVQGGHRILSSRICYEYIRDKKFDERAVKACGKNMGRFDKYLCLTSIGNVVFDKKALKLCDKFKQSKYVNNCFKAIKNADIDMEKFKTCEKDRSNVYANRNSYLYRTSSSQDLAANKTIKCLKRSRVSKKLDKCLTVSDHYTSGYYNGRRTSSYSLSYDIVELVDSEIMLSDEGEELIKVKAITADFLWGDTIDSEFYIRADKVHFSDECRR